jgi:hypothetical protein
MYTAWTQNLSDPSDKERFEKRVQGSKTVLNRLRELMEADEKAINTAELDVKTYEVSNWAYLQAHRNGIKTCLAKYKRLLTLDQQKEIPNG